MASFFHWTTLKTSLDFTVSMSLNLVEGSVEGLEPPRLPLWNGRRQASKSSYPRDAQREPFVNHLFLV